MLECFCDDHCAHGAREFLQEKPEENGLTFNHSVRFIYYEDENDDASDKTNVFP